MTTIVPRGIFVVVVQVDILKNFLATMVRREVDVELIVAFQMDYGYRGRRIEVKAMSCRSMNLAVFYKIKCII